MITKLTTFSEFHEISCVLSAFFTGVGSGVGKIPAFLANTADGLLIQQGQPSLRAPRIQGSGNDVDRAVRDFLVSYRVQAVLVVFIFRVLSRHFGFAGDWEYWGENACFSNSRWRPEQPMGISTRPAVIRLHCKSTAGYVS